MKEIKKYKIVILLTLFLGIYSNQAKAQTLDDYLQIAVENNPKVKAAYAEFEAALQRSAQASGLLDPTLTMGAFGNMETLMGTETANFQLMQMFPWFGTLGKKEDAANLMAEAKFQQYLNARNEVLFEVKSAYAEIYEVGKTIEFQEENLGILNSYRELTLSAFRSGNSSMVNVVRIDIERDGASTEIELLKDQLRPLKAEFNLMLNRAPNEVVEIKDTLIIAENEALVDGEIFFDEHPTVQLYEKQQESYQIQEEVAKKEGLPMLGVGLEYTILSKSPMAMSGMNGRDMLMPMVSVSLPIFRKKYKAMEKEAEFMARAMEQEQQMQKNQLRSEYEMTLFELKRAQRLIQLYDRQIESSRQANKLLVSGFSNNTEDFEEVLRMNQDILMLKTQQLQALKNGLTALAKMEYLFSKTE
ncbi:TolC family protein [Antarcticibacterium flavum]|uniref:TolC family protein n=1 Tax=Antarcticibacterium flavum TaxID=2058175 RepID=A0A5B7X4C2_9FLAO|nr:MULTISPECIES: TolC family protein [Antarcticibacterium]MCM4158496.1 TolC family protein [Antarcticibacterium sp. W02-3]QCY70247.1 TolC family protein [Antarcticibacterium flavum]